MTPQEAIEQIDKIELGPSDLLVIKIHPAMKPETREMLIAALRGRAGLPYHRIWLVNAGEIDVIAAATEDEAEAIAAGPAPSDKPKNFGRELVATAQGAGLHILALTVEIAKLRERLKHETDRADYWHARAVTGPATALSLAISVAEGKASAVRALAACDKLRKKDPER